MKKLINQWTLGPTLASNSDKALLQNFTNTIIDRGADGWRMWYSKYKLAEKEYNFGYMDLTHDFKVVHNVLAEITDKPGADGLKILDIPSHWNIVQPVYIRLPDGRERLYFWGHGSEGVCRYEIAESTDGVNFFVKAWRRPTLYHPNDRAITRDSLKHKSLTIYCHCMHRDPDPKEPEASEDMLMNDATNVYLLPNGTFELYSADVVELPKDAPEPHQKDPVIRFVQRRTSADGIHWSKSQRVVFRDDRDPFDLQFYYLAMNCRPNGNRIGFLGHYRSDPGTMDIECCFSKDGIDWKRTRIPDFPREKGIASVYASSAMIEKDGLYYLFYSAFNHTHHGDIDPESKESKLMSWLRVATIPVSVLDEYIEDALR